MTGSPGRSRRLPAPAGKAAEVPSPLAGESNTPTNPPLVPLNTCQEYPSVL